MSTEDKKGHVEDKKSGVPVFGDISRSAEPYPEQDAEKVHPEDLSNEMWGVDIDSYPERTPAEDPRISIFIMRVWVGLALTATAFIFSMMIAGAIID